MALENCLNVNRLLHINTTNYRPEILSHQLRLYNAIVEVQNEEGSGFRVDFCLRQLRESWRSFSETALNVVSYCYTSCVKLGDETMESYLTMR